MMYIDTHTQLNFSDFDTDRAMVIGNAKKAGVKQFIVPAVDHTSIRTALHLAKTYPDVIYAAIGFHPYEAPKSPDTSYLTTVLSDETQRKYVSAIGECGLDYHLYKGEMAAGRKDVQQRLFIEHIDLAIAWDLPIIIHCRNAFDDVFSILRSYQHLPRGVFHCFSGGLQDLRMAEELGFFIGIDGNVTYAKNIMTIVPHISPSRLLLETDAPYLTPEPYRGTRNEPKYIPLIAKAIAALRNEPVDKIAETTTANAKTLFAI